MTIATIATIDSERLDAAQTEWERCSRVAGVMVAGVKTTSHEIRRLAASIERVSWKSELERYANMLDASIEALEWLRSPVDMAVEKARSQADGSR